MNATAQGQVRKIEEVWKPIWEFDNYEVSNHGRIRSSMSGRLLALSQNQYGVTYVGLMHRGTQYHRSVPLIVANAFVMNPKPEAFDTPINLDGNRSNNRVDNLAWRPRWFAVRYNQQFRHPYLYPIHLPIEDVRTGEVSPNSFECAKRYGLLESEIVLSIANHTYVWPTYQEFRVVID
jgi:NUMOD4 motif